MPADPLSILNNVYGYSSFRGRQQEIIEHVIAGNDAVVLMPTGGGKSLCYQIPALALDGLTVVISPLIALMKDQVEALQGNGIPAAYMNSTLGFAEERVISDVIRRGGSFSSGPAGISDRPLVWLPTTRGSSSTSGGCLRCSTTVFQASHVMVTA